MHERGNDGWLTMTVREKMAALAMQGLLARPGQPHYDCPVDAVRMADALLAELARTATIKAVDKVLDAIADDEAPTVVQEPEYGGESGGA